MSVDAMKTRVQKLFHEMADLSVEARERYFMRNGVDPRSRSEVEDLLEFDQGSATSLENALGWVARDALALAQQSAIRFASRVSFEFTEDKDGGFEIDDLS